MHLVVAHTTTYRFDPPRRRVTQSHRLRPAGTAAQRVAHWEVSAPGAVFGAGFTDGAGDQVRSMTVRGPVETLSIEVRGAVETTDTAGVLRNHRETIAPQVYLRTTRTTAPGVALRTLSEKLGPPRAGSLEIAHAMANLVADKVAYTPGSTAAGATVAEVVELGRGVCQDQSQVLIALARLRGMPGRYIHGYLHSGATDLVGEAGHAWAELWIEGLGWVGFDPANRCCPDARYVRVGSGLDALDAAPIRGISDGAGGESMDISVSVAEAAPSQTQQ